jgi:hypothetical protein
MADYSSQFWSLANAITAFSVAQVIAVLIALGQYPCLALGVAEAIELVLVVSIVFPIFYGSGVCLCHYAEVAFLGEAVTRAQRQWLRKAMYGRLAAILLFTAFFYAGVWSATSPARHGKSGCDSRTGAAMHSLDSRVLARRDPAIKSFVDARIEP